MNEHQRPPRVALCHSSTHPKSTTPTRAHTAHPRPAAALASQPVPRPPIQACCAPRQRLCPAPTTTTRLGRAWSVAANSSSVAACGSSAAGATCQSPAWHPPLARPELPDRSSGHCTAAASAARQGCAHHYCGRHCVHRCIYEHVMDAKGATAAQHCRASDEKLHPHIKYATKEESCERHLCTQVCCRANNAEGCSRCDMR